jgi:uncharacterized protein YbcI
MECPKHVRPGEVEPRDRSSPSVAAMEDEICREILAIELDSYGRGATNVRAHVLDDDLVVVLLDGLKLQPSEEFLVEEGREQDVIAVRNQFEQAIAASFKGAVERATGRRVVGFTSQEQVSEPRFAIEVFRLEPV